ncbi:hypothetical protein E1287_27215 [Actinomadura sp. KC06]|uniref:hypothetical protein n=1 Tax=Actinomadura sp. KC06 TaxID=2530369 RepID=UPI001044E7BB|nr:hypothetical protein [Actinomadura sp. KC06]TDD31210.1 hypothetical protein E1287_27215 [Actinomadura sp. KC06]
MTVDPLDVDPFASADPAARIDHLYRLRRVTHRCIVRHGESLWSHEQRYCGRLTAPASIENLPVSRQPAAMAEDEAARLTDAHLYGLDEAATAAAVTCGASMVDYAADLAPGVRRGWTYVEGPPAEAGLLRWADGVGYDSVGVPLTACHWGPAPEGIWLYWWADHRTVARHNMAQAGWTRRQAQQALLDMGPLTFGGIGTTLAPCPDADPATHPAADEFADPPAHDAPSSQDLAELFALTATVMASWALLTTPGAAHLITHEPDPGEAVRDHRAGLTPRPATLATAPINTRPLQHLYTQEQA